MSAPINGVRARSDWAARAFLLCALLARTACGAEADVLAGQRLYRDGLRADGQPLTALVAGDVPVRGTQVTCARCHGRSAMGGAEGNVAAPSIAGAVLFTPAPQTKRPAYDARSLVLALREGVAAGGRSLNTLMPRYRLNDEEVAQLAAYLRSLPTEPAAATGVDNKTIRFATVITEGVPVPQRDAVLRVLQTYVDEKNRQTRLESRRPLHGPTPADQRPITFREWALDVWTLTGSSESWQRQLEDYYARAPVFAMLGGLAAGSWGPIGEFCERRELPCLFPSADQPTAGPNDFYTMYFSRGVALEAALIARHLTTTPARGIVQVYCSEVASAARALRAALAPPVVVDDLVFDCNEPLPVAALAERVRGFADTAVVLWVRREQLVGLERSLPPGRLYVSATLLERDVRQPLLAEAAGPVWMASPFRAPGEADPALARFAAWARARGIEVSDTRRQAEAFFACLAANDAVTHLHQFVIRDFMLDMIDHAQGLALYVPLYPRATLGPGQRYLNKGGYLLPVGAHSGGAEPVWIAP